MDVDMWSCSGNVREHWQRDQLEDYGHKTGRIDKGLTRLEEKNKKIEGKDLRNVAKDGMTVLSDG